MADSALVAHPAVGSVWLENARIVDNEVTGDVDDGIVFGHAMRATMNFPATCVRKWRHEPGPLTVSAD